MDKTIHLNGKLSEIVSINVTSGLQCCRYLLLIKAGKNQIIRYSHNGKKQSKSVCPVSVLVIL